MRLKFAVIFAEDPNDAQALEHLLRFLRPDIGVVRKPRRPLVPIKGSQRQNARDNARDIAAAVSRESRVRGSPVDLVIAHQDCDAFEPAHVALERKIVDELTAASVPNPVAAVPAWELEAWWYLWPDAVCAVCPSWNRLTRTGTIGLIQDVKSQLRRDLRPKGKMSVPDYDETHAPRIARCVREQGKAPRTTVNCASYRAFVVALST